jgi:hypothetical protein
MPAFYSQLSIKAGGEIVRLAGSARVPNFIHLFILFVKERERQARVST